MTARRLLTLTLGTLAILAAPALAQRPGGGQGRGMGMGLMGSPAQMLMMSPVQEELALTDEQISQIEPVAEQARADMMSRMQALRGELADLSPDDRREKFEPIVREMNDKVRGQLKEILKPEQAERLQQIELQMTGVQALENPIVAQKLKLTAEQKSKVDTVLASYRDQLRSTMESARESGDRGAVMQQLSELRSNSLKEAQAVLTDQQRDTWKAMTGEPFELSFGNRRGGPDR